MNQIYGRDFAFIYNQRFAPWISRVWPFILEAARKKKPGASTWLDLCCGTGALLEYVYRRGFSAVGLDRSRSQLAHARKNAPSARLVRGDVRKLSFPGKFDIITCLYDSLNYLTSSRDLEGVFRRVHRHLDAGGLFAFDMNTLQGLREGWQRITAMRDRKFTLILETSFDEKTALGRCRVTGFIRDGRLYRKFEEVHTERGYRAREIEDLLRRAGFSFRKFHGDTITKAWKGPQRLLYLCGIKRR